MSEFDVTIGALSSFMAGMQEPCMLVDASAEVVVANAAAREAFGDVEPVGVAVVDLLSGDGDGTDSEQRERQSALGRVIDNAWRSGRAVPTTVVTGVPPRRWRCESWRLGLDSQAVPAPYLVVHLRSHGRSVERFALLESQLEAMSREVHEHRVTGGRLRAATERLATIFGSAPIGMASAQADREGVAILSQANAALCRLTGLEWDALEDLPLAALVGPDDVDRVTAAIAELIKSPTSTREFDTFLRHTSGDEVAVTISASRMSAQGIAVDPETATIVLQFVDLTERRRYESQLRYLADHDVLTGLYNRRRFDEELEGTVARVRRYGAEAMVLLVDLDNFKGVNDSHGHATGDELLGCVARVIEGRLRESDMASRHGGDEFAILLPETDLESAVFVADQLREDILGVSVLDRQGHAVTTSVTIGVAPVTGELSGEQVLVEADVAMYDAKGAGRDRIGVADPMREEPNAVQTGHSWLQRIRDALRHDRFVLHAQPILDLRTGEISRHEILLRMDNGSGDLIAPNDFLYIAERYGLIHAIDRWVVDRSVSMLEDWQHRPGHARAGDVLEVNLSGSTITDEPTVSFIEARIADAGIDASKLVFELTETSAIVNIERARIFAERLATSGCGFALDDVGSGFGSFYYLKHLPAHVIKIDGDYIRELRTNAVDQLIVHALVDVGRGLGKEVVAEWVEDQETLDLLVSYGVDYAQGYHVGRPRPIEELDSLPLIARS